MISPSLLLLALALPLPPRAPAPNPRALVDSAIAALQRNVRLSELRSLRLTGFQHEYILGNAERAEGPWRVMYSTFSELRDVQSSVLRRTEQGISMSGDKSADRVTVLTDTIIAHRSGSRETGGSPSTFEDMSDRADASPARALTLAARASQLRWDSAVKRYGMTFDVVSFPWRNGRMRLELSQETHLPGAVEILRAYPDNFRWAPFGDVTTRFEYVNWTVQASGVIWPLQERVFLNGEMMRDAQFSAATFAADAPPADSFVVSDSARAQFATQVAQSFARLRVGMRGAPTELAPGIVRVPEFWSQTLVKQPDGVVIFEAHISGPYMRDLVAEANRRWPGAPIKALVMTSDPWAHLGGVREAIAMGVPIYVRATSIPFLTSLAKAPHTLAPDSLARAPRAPKFVPVSRKTVIGTGENRIELYPVGGPYAERMLMAYFPGHKLLYGADLVFQNRGPGGQIAPGYLETPAADLRRAVARERLDVESIFCVQNRPVVLWATFVGQPTTGN